MSNNDRQRVRRASEALHLPTEARRALRRYYLWIAASAAVVVSNTLLEIQRQIPLDTRPEETAAPALWFFAATSVIPLGVGVAARRSLRNAERASDAKIAAPRGALGLCIFAAAMFVGLTCGLLTHYVTLHREPSVTATGYVTDCWSEVKGSQTCRGSWEVAGRTYRGEMPFRSDREGEIVQFEVAANRPDIVLTQRDHGPIGIAVGIALACALIGRGWRRRARTLVRELRSAAATGDPRA